MARTILGQYGPNSSQPQAGVADSGGVMPGEDIDVMGYKPPVGPRGIKDAQTPGIHGPNQGPDGTQGATTDPPHGGPFGSGWRRALPGGSQGQY